MDHKKAGVMLKKFKNHIFAAFIPWIFFAVFNGPSQQSIVVSSLGALALMVFFNFRELRKGFILPWGSVLLFAFLFLNDRYGLVELEPIENLRLVNSTLAIIVLFSMIVGKPFTLQYAREEVDSGLWHNANFIRINWILTAIWAFLMLVMALPSYCLTFEQIHTSWFWNYGLMILCIGVGMGCNKRLPKFLRK
jgi:hypothetical protein